MKEIQFLCKKDIKTKKNLKNLIFKKEIKVFKKDNDKEFVEPYKLLEEKELSAFLKILSFDGVDFYFKVLKNEDIVKGYFGSFYYLFSFKK